MHGAPQLVPSSVPDHGCTGCGDCHRSCPTGGAAKGMARNSDVPFMVHFPMTLPGKTEKGCVI